jgi:chemotaxis protein MotB
MKTPSTLPIFAILITGSILSSCVSNQKFEKSQTEVEKLKTEIDFTQRRLNACDSEYAHIIAEKDSLRLTNEKINGILQSIIVDSYTTIEEQAASLRKLQNRIQTQKQSMEALRVSIAKALLNFETDELYVYTRNGHVYVALEENLLYKKGSNVVDQKGKDALKVLVDIIRNTSDINVIIEGHTDNTFISNKLYKDDWELGSARALSIVRILVELGFEPTRITASSKGRHHPVKTNETNNERATNRRTEIIIAPDLNELFKLLYQ